MEEAVKKALEIDGWMSEDELITLNKLAQSCNTIIEIGSWKGRSTRAMAINNVNKIYAVDTWDGGVHPDLTKIAAGIDLFGEFTSNMNEFIHSAKVLPIMNKSTNAYEYFLENNIKVDLVFIDGEHEYEWVYEDIKNYRNLLNPNGVLCGHDNFYEPVQNALRDNNVKWGTYPNTSIWYKSN